MAMYGCSSDSGGSSAVEADLRGQIAQLGDDLNAADKAKEAAEEALAELERVRAAEEAAAAAKAASDKARAVFNAIEVNAGTVPADFQVSVSSDGALAAEADGYSMGDDPDAIDGFRGATLTMDDNMGVVYSDIENPTPTLLSGVYTTVAVPDPDDPMINILTHPIAVAIADESIQWDVVSRTDAPASSTGQGTDRMTTFSGSVQGAAGTFTCTGTACEAPEPDDNGALMGASAGWSFSPDDPRATVDVTDAAYVGFGWWLNEGDEEGEYEFDAFAAAEGMTANTQTGTDLVGSATYSGGAAGKYAIESTTEDSAEGGHFTASATLTANFDADAAAAGDDVNGVSVSGVIDDFMTGDVSRGSWEVTLNAVDADTAAAGLQGADAVGPITGTGAATWSTGGVVTGTGDWSANFYGTEDETNHPTAATGEFDAAIGEIARISGAFAATK